jgi:hypothetical protein
MTPNQPRRNAAQGKSAQRAVESVRGRGAQSANESRSLPVHNGAADTQDPDGTDRRGNRQAEHDTFQQKMNAHGAHYSELSRTTSAKKKAPASAAGLFGEIGVLTTSCFQHDTTQPPLLAGLLLLGRGLKQEGHGKERS